MGLQGGGGGTSKSNAATAREEVKVGHIKRQVTNEKRRQVARGEARLEARGTKAGRTTGGHE